MKTVTMTLGVSQGVSLGASGLHVIISKYTYLCMIPRELDSGELPGEDGADQQRKARKKTIN